MAGLAQNDKISYQAVVRNSANQLVHDQDLDVTVSIANSETGTAVYTETHTVHSNANGLISLLIGDGAPAAGSNWDAVQWNKAWVTAVVSQGGTELATHHLPLSAVPYALYADQVDPTALANYLTANHYLTEEVQVLSVSNDTLYLTGGSWVKLPQGFSGDYNDLTNKPTNVSAFNNDAGYLTKDSAVITNLQGDVTTLQGDVTTLQGDVTTLQGDVTTLNTNVTQLQEATRKDALCDSVKSCVTGWISDSTRMVYDSLHAYYATTDALKDSLTRYVGKEKLNDTLDAYFDSTQVKKAIHDTANVLRGEFPTVNNGQVTIAVNRGTVDNPTFQVNQDGTQTVTINIPDEVTVNNGQLTVITPDDTTRFTANQSGNDTVNLTGFVTTAHLNDTLNRYYTKTEVDAKLADTAKYALRTALADTARNIRRDICDSATLCMERALANPNSAINHAVDTIALNSVKDTLDKYVLKIAVRDSITNNVELTIKSDSLFLKSGGDIDTVKLPAVPEQVKSDWKETNASSAAYILNKPIIKDSVNMVVKDSLRAANSAINKAIDTIALNVVKDTLKAYYDTTHVQELVHDSLDKYVLKTAVRDSITNNVNLTVKHDSLFLTHGNGIDTVPTGKMIHDSIASRVHDGKLAVITYGATKLDTIQKFTANQARNDTIDLSRYALTDTLHANYATKAALADNMRKVDSLAGVTSRDSVNLKNNYYTKTEVDTKLADTAKYALRTALADTARNIRRDICDSATACITKALADANSDINHAVDTIALNSVKDTLDKYVLKTAVRDSVNHAVADALKDPASIINHAVDTIALNVVKDTLKAYYDTSRVQELVHDSIGNGTLSIKYGNNDPVTFTANQKTNTSVNIPAPNNGQITITRNNETISKGTFSVDQTQSQTIDIAVPTKLSEMANDGGVYAKRDSVNVFTAANDFTGGSITVPSNGTAIKRPTTIPPTTCDNMNAVNVCDLLAVFDSLTKRIDALQEEVNALKNSTPPTVSLSLSEVHSHSLKATATADGHGSPITAFQFCISENSDMSNPVCSGTVAGNNNTYEYTFENLNGNKEYYVTVAATNLAGTGTASASERTPAGKPEVTVLALSDTVPSGFTVNLTGINLKESENGTITICYKEGTDCPADAAGTTCMPATAVTIPVGTTADTTFTILNLNAITDYCVFVTVSNGDSIWAGHGNVTTGASKALFVEGPEGNVYLCGQQGSTGVTTPAITYTADIVGGDTADFTYVWSTIPVEGASISSESAKCTIVYSVSGTFQVKCEATPKTGVSGTIMEKTVNTAVRYGGIVPSFIACKDNLDVTILSRSNAPILDWGDETIDSANIHTYTPGTYMITATSKDGCVATQTVVISEGTPPCHVAAHRSDAYQNNGWQGANDGYETISDTNANFITSVTDYDGNVYPVVQIGSQCWLAENMRCTHSPSTTSYLVNQEHKTGNAATKNPYAKVAHWYNNDETYAQTKFGLLYNWCAAVDTYDITQPNEVAQESLHDDAVFECELPAGHRRGICPKGWHVPTSSEWTEMEEVVNGGTLQDADWGRGSHAGKLSAGCDWHFESCMDNAPSDYKNAERSLSGFNALPAGRFSNDTYNPIIDQIGFDAYFWTCESDGNGVIEGKYFRRLEHSKAGVLLSNTTPAVGMSVRCVRDEESGPTVMQPTVTTDPAAGIDDNHATLNATINDPDAVGVDEQGFVWKPKDGSANDTIKNADLTDNHFTASLTNLTPGTRYQYWAYIIYNGYVDTTYSATKEFLTTGVAPPSASLTVTSNIPEPAQLMVCDGGTKAVTYTATVAGSTDLTPEYNYSWSVSDDMQYSSHGNTCTVICTSADENYTLSVTCTATPKSGGTPLEPFTESSVEVVSSEDDNIPMFGTCEDGLTVTLQYLVSGNASIIRWGDDSQEEYDENDNICIGKEHQYASAGTYTITTENESTGCSWTKVVYVGNANPCTGTPRSNETGQGTTIYSVKDIEGMNGEGGHEYQVVQIGSQCWMAENLRTTKFPPVGDSDPEDIHEFGAGSTNLKTSYYYRATDNDFDEYSEATYGLYYNSWAALNGYLGLDQTSEDEGPQDYIQGICPDGWHIPSKSEWIVLKNELKFDAINEFDDPAEYGAGKLSGGCDWEPYISGSVDDANPANYLYPLRNVGGFSALPAGLFEPAEGDDHFSYYPPLEEAWFWSSSYDLSYNRFYAFVLKYADEEFDEGHENENAISVRCLRNDEAWEPFDATLSVVPSPENTVGIGTDVTYTASMSGTGDFTNFTYLWVVDGNVESEGSSNTFTYTHTVTGAHTVSCTATKGINSVQTSVTTMVDALTITPSQSSFNLCPSSSQTITYTATPSLDAVDRYTYSWSDGTNTLPSTGSTCTVTYNSAGTYSVSCTATHSEENYSVTGTGGVSATSSVAPSFTYAVDTTSVIVKRISANTSITNWGGGGTEGGKTVAGYKNTVYTYNASGIYDITATTTEGCTITRKVAVGNATLHPCAVTVAHPAQTGLIGSGHETPLASSSDSIISVTDVDGNVYDVVQIGTQCWLKSNLRTRNFSDGTAITSGTMAGEGGYNALSTVSPYYYRPPVNVATPDRYFRNYIVEEYYDASGNKAAGPYTEKVFGLYYNWPAVMSEHGICPQGWHVPTEGEWNTMIGYVVNEYGAESGRYAYLLTEGNDWNRGNKGNNGTPGSYDSVLRNASEFSAIVTGFAGGSSSVEEVPNPQGKFFYRSFHYAQTYFWSSSTNGGNQAVTFNLKYTDSTLLVKDRYKNDGYSVRCVRDADGGGTTPVTTATLTITLDEANPTICGAGSATVTYTASVSEGTTDVTGNYTYEWSATGGNAQSTNTGTTYTVTYTATGSNYSVSCTATPTGGDALSETFLTTVSLEPSCLCTVSNPGTNEVQDANGAVTAVKDVQNHTYKVVKIGSQCWMAENMRSTAYSNPSGKPTLTELPSSGYTSGTAYYGYPNSESQNVETYGLLYNWKAAMGGSTVERAQGICPDGWHVPTSDEIYAMGQGVGAFYGAAGKLSGGESGTWMSSDETAAPGNYAYSERNSSGFSALPAGYHESSWRNEGFRELTRIWTSTEINPNDNAMALRLEYDNAGSSAVGYHQTNCMSVRCIRNILVVNTSQVSNIGTNSATLSATIINPDNIQITSKGFRWKPANTAAFSSHTVDINSSFTLTIDTLSSDRNYVCQAFVSTADGMFYGNEAEFETTGGSSATFNCGDALKDNDFDNNSITYATVEINGLCWMAENLRSTKYSDGDEIPNLYFPNNSAAKVNSYGYLYLRSDVVSEKGICPSGWRLPNIDEKPNQLVNNQHAGNNIYFYSGFDRYLYLWTTERYFYSDVEDYDYTYDDNPSSLSNGVAYSVRCVKNQ